MAACGVPLDAAEDAGPLWVDSGASQARQSPALPGGTALAYRLVWSFDGAARAGEAWRFDTDLGYAVTLSAIYLSSVGAELVPCEHRAAWRLTPSAAHAANTYEPDSSLVMNPVIEDAMSDAERWLGSATSSGVSYCRAHYLMAPLEGAAPDGTDMTGVSARIIGSYQAPGAGTPTPFDAAINLRGGGLRDLTVTTSSAEIMGPDGPAQGLVTITRYPARALDGEALETLEPLELAYAFLKGLGRTASAELRVRP